ncbi:MBL fold metallo-hydrolase [Arthrobacter sp. NtRootA1]|uniref:MBL fold metallo-hydrolase n=1 Tax=Arthrobacter sp. NtRootA1 TaxID=2830983 RepID=UPI001CC48C02|nr:MBL fold metallo-hydrolase [Arthrobacter sp. NtRootA1]BCW05687.1 MBL fold metallo-hydrolase [Arthrobacter sp. NtRootA1]
MEQSTLDYAVHIAGGMPTTNPDVPPDLQVRDWSPTTSTLIFGERQALLVDPLFTRAQSARLLAWLSELGKPLTSVYITHGHGDHWFGLGDLLGQYPSARAVALPEVVDEMRQQSSPEVLSSFWRPLVPDQISSNIVLANPLADGEELRVDGTLVLPIRLDHTDGDNTTCLHVPDLQLVVAGDAIYNNVHLMLAQSDADGRKSWLRALDTVESLKPRRIVAGHKDPASDDDPQHIELTRQYILDFEAGIRSTATTLALYEFMIERHPDRVNRGALWGSCRAHKGQ